MKLKNAPERKRERQLGALERLQANAKRGYYIDKFGKYRKINLKLVDKEIEVLEKRTAFSQRGIRTKKHRSA